MTEDLSLNIQEALTYMDPTDRAEWVRMAFAVKAALGESGFYLWDTWSRQDQRPEHGYTESSALSTWKSARMQGRHGKTLSYQTLFKLAWERGWRPSRGDAVFAPRVETRSEVALREQEDQEHQRREQEAARRAQHMIENATMDTHPYLQKKGYTDMKWMVHGELLLVPMRHCRTNKLQSLQTITPDGDKKFLPGGVASDAVYRIGNSSKRPIQWFVEGFATGLTVHQALAKMHRKYDQVVVCFSDGNIPKVVKAVCKEARGFVVADNDEQGAGERAAVVTGLPYWMPKVTKWDAWDYQANHGIDSLATELNQLIYKG